MPIVMGISGVLEFDIFQSGIFPGRLAKMAVDADIFSQ
jgi:hypothetical protein